MNTKNLSIAIPASVVSDTPHLREKTSKIGLIGRAAAIFQVNNILVYSDNPKVNQTSELNLISTLLEYMETPQYLRKRLFGIRPELQYAGILSPLRTPHHPLNRKMKNLKIGEYREGVTLSKTHEGTLIDVGVEQPVLLLGKFLPLGKRVTVKVTRVGRRVETELANREDISVYWGYAVTAVKGSLGKIVRSKNFDLVIATSKYGVSLNSVKEKIAEKWKSARRVLVIFGAPACGLYEIFENYGLCLDETVDFVVNTIPNQGTETVRTEEALIASLAIFNMQFNL